MHLIVCLDNQNGMCFNKRRQSRDRAVVEKIAEIAGESVVWMSNYSAGIFEDVRLNICANDCYLQEAENGCFCFAEREDLAPYMDHVEKLYVFRWNRDYPSDLLFPMTIALNKLFLKDTYELVGNSHPMITLEVYEQ